MKQSKAHCAIAADAARGLSELTRWAATLRRAEMPARTLARAALVLVDDLAAMMAARDEPEVIRLHRLELSPPTTEEATVFRGGRPRTDRLRAAVANGAAAAWCELDEGYAKAACHAGIYALPALLAEAEAARRPTGDVLADLAIAYEIACRFARAYSFGAIRRHIHGLFSAIGAASAVAAARSLPPDLYHAAITSAATMAFPGPYNHAVEGGLARNVWPAAGAWVGFKCVDWASCGIAGLASSAHDVFVTSFAMVPKPGELTRDLGRGWAIDDGFHKIHACCQYSHSSVEATLELMQRLPPGRRAIDATQIRVAAHRRGLALAAVHPATTLAAKFSLPHVIATTMVHGHAGAAAFAATTLNDAEIARLRTRIELLPYGQEPPWPHDCPARVSWVFADGLALEAECRSARGGPDRPFSAEEILTKVGHIVAPVYPAMPGLAARLVALDPSLLDAPWDRVVAALTGTPAGARS